MRLLSSMVPCIFFKKEYNKAKSGRSLFINILTELISMGSTRHGRH